jgi:hypothetical protein
MGEIVWRQARYFTYLTCAIVGIVFARIALSARASAGLCGGVMLWASTVGGVYHGLLARDLTGLAWWSDHGLHTVVPTATISWWIFFAPKATLRMSHAAYWLLWPVIYAVYALVRGAFDGRHPYFFLDPPLVGWDKVLLYSGVLTLALWVAGAALVRAVWWSGRTH